MFDFNRGLEDRFVNALNAEYERGGWWRAMATDRELFVAIRNDYLNVYWNGNSLLKLRLEGDKLIGETHYKYLLRPDAPKSYVVVENGTAKITEANASVLFLTDVSQVAALKRAALVYAGDEKKGVHRIVMSNDNVVDVEVAFRLEANGDEDVSTQRIDFAALRSNAIGQEIVFYEAKLFSNTEIRATGDVPSPVVGQIEGYRNLLREHQNNLVRSYRKVCGNLAALEGVRDRYSSMLDTMRNISTEEIDLHIDDAVRLVVFGYDSDQRDGAAWKPHREKLKGSLDKMLLLKGDAKEFTRGIAN